MISHLSLFVCCDSDAFAVYLVNVGHNEWRRKQAGPRGSPDKLVLSGVLCVLIQ